MRLYLLLPAAVLFLGACSPTSSPANLSESAPAPTQSASASASVSSEPLTVDVTNRFAHDKASFTQGLEMHDQRLFESQGLFNESAISELDPTNGSVIKRVDLPDDHFGEGLTIVDDEIVQLTWQNGIAHRWDLDLNHKGEYHYEGEGWGLCWDGSRFVMSDGSSKLTFRDRNFEKTGEVTVQRDGSPLDQLNELECANGKVYANVWHQNYIVQIDPASGSVTNTLDFTQWIPQGLEAEQVLNGIARRPDGSWLITGKQWPEFLEVQLSK